MLTGAPLCTPFTGIPSALAEDSGTVPSPALSPGFCKIACLDVPAASVKIPPKSAGFVRWGTRSPWLDSQFNDVRCLCCRCRGSISANMLLLLKILVKFSLLCRASSDIATTNLLLSVQTLRVWHGAHPLPTASRPSTRLEDLDPRVPRKHSR